MNYQQREALNAQAVAALPAVVEAGEKLGLWRHLPTETRQADIVGADSSPRWQWVTVEDSNGNRFNLHAGGWGREGMIVSTLAGVDGPGGKRFGPADVRRYSEAPAPEAQAAAKRSPEAVAKDLARRVIQDPYAVELAGRLRAMVAEQHAQRAQLVAHVETLKGLGYGTYRDEGVPAQECYQVQMWGQGLPDVKVTYAGSVNFSTYVDVSQMAAVLAALRPAAS